MLTYLQWCYRETGMARKLRVEYPGAIYHVMNRGDRREPIFQDDENRQRFLATQGLPNACVWERPAKLITRSTANGRRNENECMQISRPPFRYGASVASILKQQTSFLCRQT